MSTQQGQGHENEDEAIVNGRAQLAAILEDIDEDLADFRELLSEACDCEADYSPGTLAKLEELLIDLKPNLEDDKDLLNDAVFYLGETLRRNFGGTWAICDDAERYPEQYGTPMISGHSPYEGFFPFQEMQRFLAAPAPGYFMKAIAGQVDPG